MPVGTPLYAVKAGRISYVDSVNNQDGMGLRLTAGSEDFLYWHVSSIAVSPGQTVSQGQVIALSGNTGYSTGPHLHFELKVNGVLTDPSKYLKEGGADMLTRQQLSKLWYGFFHHDINQGGLDAWGNKPAGEIIDYLDTTDEHRLVADAYTLELPALRDKVAGEHQRTQTAIDVAVATATAPYEALVTKLRQRIAELEGNAQTQPRTIGQLLAELVTRILRPKGGEPN